MPPVKLEDIEFNFTYANKEYTIGKIGIFDENGCFVCNCDLTGTVYYGNEGVHKLVARNCLKAYFDGIGDGKRAKEKEIQEVLGLG